MRKSKIAQDTYHSSTQSSHSHSGISSETCDSRERSPSAFMLVLVQVRERESAHARRSLESRTKLSACYMLGRPKRKVIVQGNKLEFGGALKAYLTSFMVPVPAGGFENSGLLNFCQSARAEGLLQLACRVKFGGEVRLRGTPASAVYIWGGRKWLPPVPCDEGSRARHPTSLHLYDAAGFHHN